MRLGQYLRYLPKSVGAGILITNFVLFVAMTLYANLTEQGSLLNIDARTLVLFGGKWPALAEGRYWRLITAGFLHAGLLHLSVNSGMLLDLGNRVQAEFGPGRTAVIYFASIVAGFTASIVWSYSLSVGSSPGLCGLAGAMIVLGLRQRSAIGRMIRRQYLVWLLSLFVWSLVPGSRVDTAANCGGLAGGMAAAWVSGLPGRSLLADRVWKGVAYVCLFLTCFAFLRMVLFIGTL
ncbi:MAG: rhomboid family intramembrane serine protease [Acidobacteriia bacterium]|nr:rhomboid family intramembrane serine protease [Terriglobia bacterium]